MTRKSSWIGFFIILAISSTLVACGGGGGGGSETPPAATPTTSVISGVITDGPIRNARVSLDLNLNGKYDVGEPFSITNERGEYRIEYVLTPGIQYMLIVEGSPDLGTSDLTDNADAGTNLTFIMLGTFTAAGARGSSPVAGSYTQDVNPSTFKGYLIQYNMTVLNGCDNPVVIAIINMNVDSVTLFRTLIRDNQDALLLFAQQAATNLQLGNDGQGQTNSQNLISETGSLYSVLRNGSVSENFPGGIATYIDTKTVYRNLETFLGLNTGDDAAEDLINKNVRTYLTDGNPTFYSGNGSLPAWVTVDSTRRTIKVDLSVVGVSTTTVTWKFDPGRVTGTYAGDYTSGEHMGSAYRSTSVFSPGQNNLIYGVFTESVNEYKDSLQTLAASYEGTYAFSRVDGSLQSARFKQKVSEPNIVTNRTKRLDGLVTMQNGVLDFSGSYSFDLPSYGVVSGLVVVQNGAYERGYNPPDSTYVNANDLQNANVKFSLLSPGTAFSANTAWLIGSWGGTFTDSCGAPGGVTMFADETMITWWGQSADMSRNYGTSATLSGASVLLKNNGLVWSNVAKITDTRLQGNWSDGVCQGSVVLDKQ